MSIGSALSQVFNMFSSSSSSNPNSSLTRDFPFMNTIILDNSSQVQSSHLMANRKKVLMTWYEKNSAILCGQINKIVKDINEEVYFEPLVKGSSGRNKVKRAKEFYENNRMRSSFNSMITDLFVTGEAYGFKNNLPSSQIKGLIGSSLKSKGIPHNKFTEDLFLKVNSDIVDINTLRKFTSISSSTIENVHDAYNIISYLQRVGGIVKQFKPEDIIHVKFLNVNGRPEGFTPVSTIVLQLELDYFMWKNMFAIAKNSGQPDRLYSVEDMDINSQSFKRIQQELQKYHNVRERHGSLLLNGKVKVEDLQQLDSMQFENMGIYIAGLIALQFGIPRSRLPMLSKAANTKEDTGGNSEKDYYDNVSYTQDVFSLSMNQELWIPHFQVKMKFRQSYKQDEIRENQNQQLRYTNMITLNGELRNMGKQLTQEYVIRYVNGISEELEEDDLEEYVQEILDPMSLENGSSTNPQSTSTDSEAKKKLSERRSKEQLASNDKKGKPTGTGKSLDPISSFLNMKNKELIIDNELSVKELKKDLEFKEIQRVPFLTFLRLYNEDKSFNKEPPRLFMSNNNEMARMTYLSTDFVYETIVPISELSPIIMMNFRKIYKMRESDILNTLDSPKTDKPLTEEVSNTITEKLNSTNKRVVVNLFKGDK